LGVIQHNFISTLAFNRTPDDLLTAIVSVYGIGETE
jgi:hypothetical protein